MDEVAASVPQPAPRTTKRRRHWHVLFTHFPISFFGGAFGFQILHLFMAPACFELATNVALIGGAFMLIPTIWTGWSEWKKRYQGAKGLIFRQKIRIAAFLAAFSLLLVIWRIAGYGLFTEARELPVHWIYLSGNTLLIAGAVLEGVYGGRLAHR
jgi:uncharacterized membrane protein